MKLAGAISLPKLYCILLLLVFVSSQTSKAESAPPSEVNLAFTLAGLEFADQRFRNIAITCKQLNISINEAACPGAMLSLRSEIFGRLDAIADVVWHPGRDSYRVQSKPFGFAGGTLQMAIHKSPSGIDSRFELERTNAAKLWAMLASYLPQDLLGYSVDSGTISGDIHCKPSLNCDIDVRLNEFNFSGVNAAEDAEISIAAQVIRNTDAEGNLITSLNGAVRLDSGAVYIEPGFKMGDSAPGFLLASTAGPVRFEADLDLPGETVPFKIRRAAIFHPEVVEMLYEGDLTFAEDIVWQGFEMSVESPYIEKFYETYVQPVIFGTTVDSLEMSGAISTRLEGRDNEITDLRIVLNDTYFDDAFDRFAIYKLRGDFVLSSAIQTVDSKVTWEGASVYGIPLGSGEIDWGSKQRNVWISGWDAVSMFDGEMHISQLSVTDFGTRDAKVSLSGSLSPVSMPEVMASFGLPAMAGKVSATLPELSFQRNKLVLDGEIEVKLFNGVIGITDFEIQDLFSRVPSLYANVEALDIDLATLTSTFSFGNISGTLDGYIKDLHLEAWQPVSFDAYFGTREDDPVRHRISRQAVDNLGRIGAQTSALSSGWLRFIPNYSYGQLGLGCRFERGYCNMSGVASADGEGFYVLTQGGLLPPWINIQGQGRLISWRNLIDGIKQISTGEVAVELGAEVPQQVQ